MQRDAWNAAAEEHLHIAVPVLAFAAIRFSPDLAPLASTPAFQNVLVATILLLE